MPSPLIRRAISIFTVVTAFGVILMTGPLLLLIAVGVDFLMNREKFPRSRFVVFIAWFLFCELGGVVGGLVIGGLCFFPGTSEKTYVAWNLALQRWWSGSIFSGLKRIFSLKMEVEGVEATAEGPLVVLTRHVSSADSLLPSALVANRYHHNLRFVMKESLQWDPCLDIVGNRLPNAFIPRNTRGSPQALRAIEKVGMDLDSSSGVVIFPEGTRFTRSKLEVLRTTYTKGSGRADPHLYEHVLPPKFGGTVALLKTAIDADIVFCAHTGLEAVGNIWDLVCGDLIHRTIRIRFWRVSRAEVPVDEEALLNWLVQSWKTLDRAVGHLLSLGE